MVKQIKVIEPHTIVKDNNIFSKIRVAAYCRVSSDSAKQLMSFVTQREYYEELISKKSNWELVEIYADEGITGTKRDKRDEFNRMIDDCEDGKIDLIITKSFSRFARNTLECIDVIRKLKLMNIAIIFEKENINTLSAESEMMLTILSSIAQEESISISKNQRWSYRKRFTDGRWKPANITYGYTKDQSGEIIKNIKERDLMKAIFDRYLMGWGTSRIARELDRLGYKPKKGEKWSEHTISDILSDCVYSGDLLMQKTYMSDAFPYRRCRNRGEKEKYIIKNNHEPYLTEEESNRIAMIREYRRKERKIDNDIDKYKNKYELSGIIKCKCGGTFKRQIRKTTNGEYVQWVCVNHVTDKNRCELKAIKQEKINKAIDRMWNKMYGNYEYILGPLLQTLKNDNNSDNIIDFNNRINELNEQSLMLSRLLSKGYIDSAIFIEKSNAVNTQLEELKLNKKKSRALEFRNEVKQTEKIIEIIKNDDEEKKGKFEIIKEIFILSDSNIEINLINGLKLSEKI